MGRYRTKWTSEHICGTTHIQRINTNYTSFPYHIDVLSVHIFIHETDIEKQKTLSPLIGGITVSNPISDTTTV